MYHGISVVTGSKLGNYRVEWPIFRTRLGISHVKTKGPCVTDQAELLNTLEPNRPVAMVSSEFLERVSRTPD